MVQEITPFFCFYDSVAQGQISVFIRKFQTDAGTVTGSADMGVIEFYKIIFKSCLCQAFKGYTCSIDSQVRVLA